MRVGVTAYGEAQRRNPKALVRNCNAGCEAVTGVLRKKMKMKKIALVVIARTWPGTLGCQIMSGGSDTRHQHQDFRVARYPGAIRKELLKVPSKLQASNRDLPSQNAVSGDCQVLPMNETAILSMARQLV